MNTELLVILMLVIGGSAIVAGTIAYLYYVRIWFRAYTLGAPVSFARLFGLTARRLSAYKLISAHARAIEEGVSIELDELESAYAGGHDPRRIVQLLIEAHRNGRPMTVQQASERIGHRDSAAMAAVNQEG